MSGGGRTAGGASALAALVDKLFPVVSAPGAALDPAAIELAEKLLRPLATYFRTEIVGAGNIPAGGALLVSNHGPLGFDAVELVFGLYRRTGRLARGLAEKTAFRVRIVAADARRACLGGRVADGSAAARSALPSRSPPETRPAPSLPVHGRALGTARRGACRSTLCAKISRREMTFGG